MSESVLDFGRMSRIGVAEAVLCQTKSAAQINAILSQAAARNHPLLLTRLDVERFESLDDGHKTYLHYDSVSRTAFFGVSEPRNLLSAAVIVTAGTSDIPVAAEAARTLNFHGYDAPVISDVGVAGLWRLLDRLEEIRRFRVVIAVAGMEGALFSVLGGLVSAPLIAVPTSVGYGIAQGGRVALDTALASCASGIVAVNIDNGFGAACATIRILNAKNRTAPDLSGADIEVALI